MSDIQNLAFVVLGGLSLCSAVGTVAMRRPLRSALSLFVFVLCQAGLYLGLFGHLLTALQVILYAGAVVVLFIFVIMVIGPTIDEMPSRETLLTRGLKACAAAGIFAVMFAISVFVFSEQPLLPAVSQFCAGGSAECDQFGGIKAIGHGIFVETPLVFELISLLLLVSVIGAIVIAKGRDHAQDGGAKP